MLDRRPASGPPEVGTTERPDDSLVIVDLLKGPAALAAALVPAVAGGQWLDAYLLSAGLLQLVEDRAHPDPWQLRRGAQYLRKGGSRWARSAGATVEGGAAALDRIRGPLTGGHRLAAAGDAVARLTSALADLVLCPETSASDHDTLRSLADRAGACATLVGHDVVRPPACFRSFDQHPDDVRWLTEAFLDRFGRLTRPVAVVGVRTSGSYLAPLFGAALRRATASRVDVLTHRPGRPFQPWEREVLRATARAGGRVLVTDDPPGTGSSLAATVTAIEQTGVPGDRVTLVLSLFGDQLELPPALRGRSAVLQPWSELSVHRRLDAVRVRDELTRMLPGGWRVEACRRLDEDGHRAGRRHAHGRYLVALLDPATGQQRCLDLMVEGAGLGYLGRQALGVADALRDRVPRIYGFSDGLLYREWLDRPSATTDTSSVLEAVAEYVAHRRRALPASDDPTPRMRGRDPAWEVAAELMGKVYGPLAPVARPYLLEPVTRRLLRTRQPSVVDGATATDRWLPDPGRPSRWVKVDFHQRAFSHLELACYDAAFDLAGAVGDPPSRETARALKAAYHRETGESVDGERWLLYRLTHVWRGVKAGEVAPRVAARRSADAVHDYLADALLRDLPPGTGALCAIDLDGVLETDRLGYPATGTAGALALRGLVAHGYRPVLATGRSLIDARDRSTTFGLAGAVAEYGAVVFDQTSEQTIDLRTPDERELVERLREELARSGFEVDPGYEYAVRARASGGPLPPDAAAEVPLLRHPSLQVVHGQSQSDVTVRRLSKATGLRVLEALVGAPCAFAVGDSAADVSMLRMAPVALAPRNADAQVRAAGVRITRGAYQRGLLDAASVLLGHRPGTCPVCAPPQQSRRTRELLAVLALTEAGTVGLPRRTVRLALLAGGRGIADRLARERTAAPRP